MALVFCLGLLVYYVVFLGKRSGSRSALALLLWVTYFALGCAAVLGGLTGNLDTVFDPSYPATLFLLLCILISLSGFLGFRSRDVRDVVPMVRGQGLIEIVLIGLQAFSIAFFLPFALGSLQGDVAANRLESSSTLEVLGSYGLINTIAGMGSHLFAASLVMAFIRLCQPRGEGYSLPRAILLVLASLSYVIYILAYVGRDGAIYWLMTALLVFIIFRAQLPTGLRRRIVIVGASLGGLLLLPIVAITVARFASGESGLGGGLWDYFGIQINNFSDYSRIDRPVTYGAMSFPLFKGVFCSIMGSIRCETWDDIKPFIFDHYLAQGMQPWLFGTYVSDFVADFGYVGTAIVLTVFAPLCHRACVGRDSQGQMSLSRLLMIIFLFLTPYWGVFYFRFGIINPFLVVNILFIFLVWGIQLVFPATETRRAPVDPPPGNMRSAGPAVLPEPCE
jgi:hypothetical protein